MATFPRMSPIEQCGQGEKFQRVATTPWAAKNQNVWNVRQLREQ
jgi:hypothetical protein